jgi:hypothetical protein
MINKRDRKRILEKVEREFLPKLYEELCKDLKLFFKEIDGSFSVGNITFHWHYLYGEFKDYVSCHGLGSNTSLLNTVIKVYAFFDLAANNMNYKCTIDFIESDYGKDNFSTKTIENLLINIES